MAHLIVQDLKSGVDLDRAAWKTLRGGINNVGLGKTGGSVGAGQNVSVPSGLLFASPIITTQLVFAFDITNLVAPMTEVVSTINTTNLIGSILNQYGGDVANVPV